MKLFHDLASDILLIQDSKEYLKQIKLFYLIYFPYDF